MKTIRFATLVAAIACITTWRVSADDELPDHNLSEWRAGETLVGTSVDLKKTEGKVVAIEYWGTR